METLKIMENLFDAKSCPECEPTEVTTYEDINRHKRVFVCANPICIVHKRCKTIYEETFKGMQILLPSSR